MTDNDPPPKHRYELSLTLGANTWRRLWGELDHISTHLCRKDPGPQFTTSGGGWHLEVVEHPEVTQESFEEALEAWCERRRQARKEDA